MARKAPGGARHGAIEVDFDDSDFKRFFKGLNRAGQNAVFVGMQRLARDTLEHAQELLERLIYATPERGGYERTGKLRRGVRTYVTTDASGPTLWLIATADYSDYNERGTYDYKIEPSEIIAKAQASNADLILLEYGRNPGLKGLEPRPWHYVSSVWAQKNLPRVVYKAILDAVSRG
jgi:hypothetical protein